MMMDQTTKDIFAAVLVVYGLIVTAIEHTVYVRSKIKYRWVFLVQGIVGFLCSLTFLASLLRFYDGTDTIAAEIGRPLFLFLLTAMLLSALVDLARGPQ
jgi:uncharacterized membrane protein